MRNFLAVTLIDCTPLHIIYVLKKNQKAKPGLPLTLFILPKLLRIQRFIFCRFLQTTFTQKVMQVDIFLDIEKPRTVPLFRIYRYLFKGTVPLDF
jgi:hypothetical protein